MDAVEKKVVDLVGKIAGRLTAVETKISQLVNFDQSITKHGLATYTKPGAANSYEVALANVTKLTRQIADGTLRQKALSEGSGTAGGYLVPDEFHRDLFAIALGKSVMRPIASVLSMGTDTLNLASLTTDWAVDWFAEADSITAADPVFGQPILKAKKMASRFVVSNELLRDSQIDLLQQANRRWLEVFGKELDRVIFQGDTTADPKEPANGIMVDTAVAVVTLATGQNTYAEVTPDDLLSLVDAVDPSDSEGARFFMHHSLLNQLRKTKDLQDAYLIEVPSSGIPFQAGGEIVTRLWGHPVTLIRSLPKISDGGSQASKKFVAFGRPENVVIGLRQETEVMASEHASFATDETQIRATMRLGFALPRPAAFSVLKTSAT